MNYPNQTTVSDTEPQGCVDSVRNLFGGTASVLLVSPVSEAIPESLRHPDAGDSPWKLPEQIIGVECGPLSQGLGAIGFPDKGWVGDFIAQNPEFGSSLITFWPRSSGYRLWVRSEWLPSNTSMDGISLVSKGVVTVAVAGLDLSQFVARPGPVPALSFTNIKWSAERSERFRIILLQEGLGPPHRRSASGKVIINKMFWGHFLAEKLELIFHLRLQTFLRRKPESAVAERIGPDELMRLMLCEMQQTAARHLPDFPMDAITLPILKRIIEVMKIVAGVNTPGEREDFSAFLEACVAERAGSSLTIGELYIGYAKARRSSGQEPYPEAVFQKLIPELVYGRFQRRKSHDLIRQDDGGTRRCTRGFHGLGWNTSGGAGDRIHNI